MNFISVLRPMALLRHSLTISIKKNYCYCISMNLLNLYIVYCIWSLFIATVLSIQNYWSINISICRSIGQNQTVPRKREIFSQIYSNGGNGDFLAVNLVYEDFNIKLRESDHSISDQIFLSILKSMAANCKNNRHATFVICSSSVCPLACQVNR